MYVYCVQLALLCTVLLRYVFAHDCDQMFSCNTCTRRKSWTRQPCRWCPVSSTCHAHFSPVNPCRSYMNVKKSSRCDTVLHDAYNPNTAYEMAILSAVAYSDEPARCLDLTQGQSGYIITHVIARRCDDYMFSYKECLAFIAVSHKRKSIVVSYRGTHHPMQLVDQLITIFLLWKRQVGTGGKAQHYFSNANDKMYSCVRNSLRALVRQYSDYSVTLTGHSLGGAVASIASAALVLDGVVRKHRMSLYTFGMPRVGDRDYAFHHDRLVNNSWRIVNKNDFVTQLPACLFGICRKYNIPYHHRSEVFYYEQAISHRSPYRICHGSEDRSCSKGNVAPYRCLLNYAECKEYHKVYFGIHFAGHCRGILGKTNGRSRRSNLWDKITDKDCCVVAPDSDERTNHSLP